MPKTYATIEDFYAENEERRRSGEADYGVWWTESKQSWLRWQVSYIRQTGEVYAVQLTGGRVEILGVVQADDEDYYYRTLDRILDGWSDIIQTPGSLEWLRAKLKRET